MLVLLKTSIESQVEFKIKASKQWQRFNELQQKNELAHIRKNLKCLTAFYVPRSLWFAVLLKFWTFKNICCTSTNSDDLCSKQGFFGWTRMNCNELKLPWQFLSQSRINCSLLEKLWQYDLGFRWLTQFHWHIGIPIIKIRRCVSLIISYSVFFHKLYGNKITYIYNLYIYIKNIYVHIK